MPISTRLFKGMLTPAMRAMSPLPLPLLVSRVRADHENPAVTPDDLALLAHRLDRRTYLHVPFRMEPAKVSSAPARVAHRHHRGDCNARTQAWPPTARRRRIASWRRRAGRWSGPAGALANAFPFGYTSAR